MDTEIQQTVPMVFEETAQETFVYKNQKKATISVIKKPPTTMYSANNNLRVVTNRAKTTANLSELRQI